MFNGLNRTTNIVFQCAVVLCSYENILLHFNVVVKNFLKFFSTFFWCSFQGAFSFGQVHLSIVVTICQQLFKSFFEIITVLVVIGLSYSIETIRYFLNIKLFEYQTILLIENHSHLRILVTIPIISDLPLQRKLSNIKYYYT